MIAHPERNAEVKDDPERVAGLVQQGALVEEAGADFSAHIGCLGRPCVDFRDSGWKGSGSVDGIKEAARALGVNRARWVRKMRGVNTYDSRVRDHLGYVLFSPEVDNYTYELANQAELVAWLDTVIPGSGGYVEELTCDQQLARELRRRLRFRPSVKQWLPFGRRAAWYAVVRSLRPELVVETGTHDGLGSTALLAALDRNCSGRLVSIDPRPGTGWLVPERLRDRWERIQETSFAALERYDGIGVFIHDSAHTIEVESWELKTALSRSVRPFALLSDNAHAAETYASIVAAAGAVPHLFLEQPAGTFYPGAGVGLSMISQIT